ncbi:MAG TPA: carboxypeptidase regulatory-like domain-containing protein [Gemmatimonadaceae bacterium]|nr:carboxypeptidase regulatory-like domain-containing protein [Gemmatimonadaceae bacterium]
MKYRVFQRERRPDDGKPGLVMLQIDALAYAELRRAIELGYCPTIEQMVREEGYTLRRWFCGLPSATPYAQAGIFHGENDGIPAFRFYDKTERRVITCNTPAGVQYIRDRIHSPGALAGGSSYVNLLDGDAQTVAFTVATRERMSVFRRLGGWRMAMLILLHPIRVARMGLQAILEWLREEYERGVGELGRKRTHSEGLFPFVRVLSNVVVRELQTMAILLDVYLGVPIIYSTFMQYDELAHHFGPSSFQALRDLRRTDARIREIRRMIESHSGRQYDIVILSDHGMTPSSSYRVRFGETMGRTVERILEDEATRTGEHPLRSTASFALRSEYADMGAQVVQAVADVTPEHHRTTRRALLRFRDWLRSRYGLRELILPEKYRVEAQHEVVVTYSSDLAHLYFVDDARPLELNDITADARRGYLYNELLHHAGVGLLGTRNGPSVHLQSTTGSAVIVGGELAVVDGVNPLEPYGSEGLVVRAVEHLVMQRNAGDIVLFGAYDGYEIVSFDDQIGAHGAAGGNQLHPFLIGPAHLELKSARLEDARDLHAAVLQRYASSAARVAAAGCLVLGALLVGPVGPLGARRVQAQVPAASQSAGVIAGRVIDASTLEPRPGASVAVVGTPRGAIADSAGRFVISGVPAGDVRLRARMLGYKPTELAATVKAGDTTRVDVRLAAEATLLGPVRTEARALDRERFEARPNVGTVQLTTRAAEGIPKFGEPDIIRVVQLLPGVEARNDFTTGLNVRGGEADQNLILLDGYPIYNPFHLGGLFSTFMVPTVRDLTLMTGGFPARYGGRLSSVLDVHSADEPRPGVHGTAEVSLLATTGALGGSFAGGKGSWTIGGRRTYADKFVKLIGGELPYHFRDEQVHASYAFTPTTHLAFTMYDGRDALDANMATLGDSTSADPAAGTIRFGWGNTIAGATLTKTLASRDRRGFTRALLGDSTTLEQRASISTFSTMLDLGAGSLTLHNSVADRRLAGSITAHTGAHDRTYGYDVARYGIGYDASALHGDTRLYDLRQRPTSAAGYVDDLWRASPSWLVEAGLRGEALTGSGWLGVSPRLSVKHFLSPDFALTAAVGQFTQSTHSLAREDLPVRLFDFWVSSDSAIPVSRAWHYIGGAERWFGGSRYARVEGFYKRYDRLLEANPQEDPGVHGDEFLPVAGESYGADFMLRQLERGPFSGWVSYTYAVATRVRDSLHYFPGHDRRHDLNVVANWRLAKYVLGVRFGYASGTPYTDIVGQIVRRVYDPGTNEYGTRGGGSQLMFIGGARNGQRLPATQRLDIDLTREFQVRGASVAPYLSVVNAYNARNVFLYVFDYTTSPPTRQAISQFPFLPSAGVTIHF